MAIDQRFKEVLYKLRINNAELAKELDVTPTAISKSVKGDSLPSAKLLIPLGEKLGVSIDWLLFGKGTMLMDENSNNEESNESNEVKHLKEQITLLKKAIVDKEEIIDLLKSNQS